MIVAILLPVLNRPERVKPLVESIRAAGKIIPCKPLFLVSPQDKAERDAIVDAGAWREPVDWEPGRGDYARKINWGFKVACAAGAEFVFLGADDLVFHPGWIERAVACWYETGACVIGTNDLGNQRVQAGAHSTHTLVHRDYLECGTADDDGRVLHDGYWHNFVDDEFVQTARWRGTFAAATDSIVEHAHPDWGKAVEDDTYRKGQEHFNADRALFNERRYLWHGEKR